MTLPATLRKLAAHLDPSDPARPTNRGRSCSPYMGDFELSEEYEDDLRIVRDWIDGQIPHPAGVQQALRWAAAEAAALRQLAEEKREGKQSS